jgi:hypothetical protein
MKPSLRMVLFLIAIASSATALAAGAEMQVLYRETFDRGPAVWIMGKNRPSPPGWHRNVLGHYGEAAPLAWSASGGRAGGFASSEPPWYFDDNHGEFLWLHLPLVAYSKETGVAGKDLRNAELAVSLRGRGFDPKGTTLLFWIQGPERPGTPMRNWALTAQPLEGLLADGQWHDARVRLAADESRWTFMGHTNGGLARKVRVTQTLASGRGTLAPILAGGHVDWGFLLCGVDPNDPPAGRIDLDEVTLSAPSGR